jgi:PKD repeat protein
MVWAWGRNNYGQLGRGLISAQIRSPVSIIRPGSYIAIAAGQFHSLAIDSSGLVYGWGNGGSGALGNLSISNQTSPVSTARSGIYVAVFAGIYSSYAIDDSGMIWSWGFNSWGRLGTNNIVNYSSPVSIVRPGSYRVVSTQNTHVLAIDAATGMVWSWGYNVYGMLGDNSTDDRSSPVSICRPGSYIAISAGYYHSLAIEHNGTVWAWGYAGDGELGNNNDTIDCSSPISIARAGNYFSLASGNGESYAIDSNFTPSPPLPVTANFSGEQSGIAPFTAHFTDLSTGPVTTWLWNFGDGGTSTFQNPAHNYMSAGIYDVTLYVSNSGFSDTITKQQFVSIGDMVSVVYTWGQSNATTRPFDISNPATIVRPGSYKALVSGYYFGMLIDQDGMIWTWNDNRFGQLGINSDDYPISPVSICRSASYTKVHAHGDHALAIDDSGMIWSWGLNTSGQIGDGTTSNRSSPVSILRAASYVSVYAGDYNSFAIDDSGMIWAWGENSYGQLGNNSSLDESSPVSIVRPGSYITVASTTTHTLAIDAADGMIWAWGSNNQGQLGDNTVNPALSPVSIARPGSYVAVAVSDSYGSYALDSDGTVWFWGNDAYLTDVTYSSPVSIIPGSYRKLQSQRNDRMLLDFNGKIWGWGYNGYGELGDYSIVDKSSPVSIVNSGSFTDISIGYTWAMAQLSPVQLPIETVNLLATPTSGSANLPVNFTDLSTLASSWLWNFGDGTTSTAQNPSHTYITAGVYNVTLAINNSQDKTLSRYVRVDLVSNFSGDTTSGGPPLSVNFTDLSLGVPTSWSWNFGDGTISTSQNPTHVYAITGNYTVTLDASRALI